ncbi:MAG: o-succinylbenzoate synthase [Bacteroidota bacterium]|nr:o-succinylbenzoate synthase [Bacteroidota bacterium]
MFKAKAIRYRLNFKQPAGTSRGTYLTRDSWFIILEDSNNPELTGIGECAPLPSLSCDDRPDYEFQLLSVCERINKGEELKDILFNSHTSAERHNPEFNSGLIDFPSIRMGLETAKADLRNGGERIIYPSPFTTGEAGLPINGLIWMGDASFMQKQIEKKLKAGFHCIKMKIGAIDFETEFSILKAIRQRYPASDIQLRVDANGAFPADQALERLKRLSELDLHSIEQPIKAGQWELMALLVEHTPLPIALDEELIGINRFCDKKQLLDTINPQYIILKPSLHGGISGCNEWIELAKQMNIGWWITSALESNIGLNAIAQWTATLNNPLHQGLGTGQLFTNNFDSPLEIRGEKLFINPAQNWKLNNLYNEGLPITFPEA